MKRGVFVLFMAALLVAAPVTAQPSPAVDGLAQAKRAETRAFAAIDEERWCEAMHAFLEANAAAPSLDLVYNAAQAADLADDRKQALRLYIELLGAYPDSERQSEVDERIGALSAQVRQGGEGTACPAPAAPAEEREPTESEAPAPEPLPAEPATGSALPPVVPWTVAGLGAALGATGGVLSVVGALPYFDFLAARGAILEAEKGGLDASAAQQRQASSRTAWESYGEASVLGGVALGVLGASVAVGGLVWALLTAPAEGALEAGE